MNGRTARRAAAAAALGLAAACGSAVDAAEPPSRAGPIEAAIARWEQSPHGTMLARVLPRAIEPAGLPEPGSEGARLLERYCVQCHHLPSPHMHAPARWKSVVDRMVWRMRGNGNLGSLMSGLMAGVQAPSAAEAATLTAYLERHGQQELDPARYPAVNGPEGRAFAIACAQCHALPDPARHTAREWPRVIERMRGHMTRVNVVTGSRDDSRMLEVGEIERFLVRHARAR